MQLRSAIRTALDDLASVQTNSDYPNVRVPQITKLLRTLLPYFPGIAVGSLTGDADQQLHVSETEVAEGDQDADINYAVNADLRFDPKLLIYLNETTGALGLAFSGMTAATVAKLIGGSPGPEFSIVSSNGVTFGTRSFTVGKDADLNSDAGAIKYFALGL